MAGRRLFTDHVTDFDSRRSIGAQGRLGGRAARVETDAALEAGQLGETSGADHPGNRAGSTIETGWSCAAIRRKSLNP
nr:hypothetical protein [Neorhizobium galegae]